MRTDEANGMICPIARIKPGQPSANCSAPDCILWRWLPIMTSDPRYVAAVRTEAARQGGGIGAHMQALAAVAADPEAFGVPSKPDHGFCGLGGEPKA